jgi:predicted TPR repeat methyltransferase
MSDDTAFLPQAYTVETTEQAHEFYDAWARTYDAEIGANGYATPMRCAAALAEFLPDRAAPILDFGCGTGLAGVALAAQGFSVIDGTDLSAEMLKQAASRGVYRRISQSEIDTPFDFETGAYAAILAVGVIAHSHAPASTIDLAMAHLASGGLFVFSLNDHTLSFPEFEARVAEHVDTGNARLKFKEYGDHLPGHDLKANVYVLEKA